MFNAIGKIIMAPIQTAMRWMVETVFTPVLVFLLEIIIDVLFQLVWTLLQGFIGILDFMQQFFKILSGIGTFYTSSAGTSGGNVDGDLVSFLTQSPIIQNMFMVLGVVAVILILVLTIVKIIRNTYQGNNEETHFQIIGRGFKAVAIFFVIPISVIFGLQLSAIFLKGFDNLTSSGGVPVKVSNQVTLAGMADANRARANGGPAKPGGPFASFNKADDYTLYEFETATGARRFFDSTLVNVANGISLASVEEKIDYVFSNNLGIAKKNGALIAGGKTNTNVLDNEVLVATFYDMSQANYLVLVFALVCCLFSFMSYSFSLVKRIYEMLLLYLTSPITLAFAPFDNLSGFTSKFVKPFYEKALSAYGIIVSLNIFFLLLPILKTIQFFPKSQVEYNSYANMFITLGGLFFLGTAKEMITNLFGAEGLQGNDGTNFMKGKLQGGAAKLGAMGARVGAKLGKGALKGAYKVSGAQRLGRSLTRVAARVKAGAGGMARRAGLMGRTAKSQALAARSQNIQQKIQAANSAAIYQGKQKLDAELLNDKSEYDRLVKQQRTSNLITGAGKPMAEKITSAEKAFIKQYQEKKKQRQELDRSSKATNVMNTNTNKNQSNITINAKLDKQREKLEKDLQKVDARKAKVDSSLEKHPVGDHESKMKAINKVRIGELQKERAEKFAKIGSSTTKGKEALEKDIDKIDADIKKLSGRGGDIVEKFAKAVGKGIGATVKVTGEAISDVTGAKGGGGDKKNKK